MPPISRRSLLLGSAALALTAGDLSPAFAQPTKHTRPTGRYYIRYEDLYRKGDTVSEALARLREPKIVTFPEGKFVCSDFSSGYQSGINVPAICRGIVGSGRGTLGGSTGTVFTMKPHSSTKGKGRRDSSGRPYVPKQDNHTPCQLTILRQLNQRAPAHWRHFQVAGTEQEHIFNAFQVWGTAGANHFENLLITGWDGNSGAPPGETHGFAVNGPGEHRLAGVEADGRRTPGGKVFGAMGITAQNTIGVTLDSCYAHHVRAASFVAFQSIDGTMTNCFSDARVPADRMIGEGSFNFERTTGWRMVRCRIIGRQHRVHITHSNDRWALHRGGRSSSVANGRLTVLDPIYNDLWGNDYLMIQSWAPYWTGDSMRTAPTVLHRHGQHRLPYAWVHGRSHLIK